MATVALQLTAIIQEPATDHLAQTNGANTTPINANQAQAAAAQQDTVNLTPQAAQNQLTGQEHQAQQPTELFIAEAVIFGPPNTGNTQAVQQNGTQEVDTENQNAVAQQQQQTAAQVAVQTPGATQGAAQAATASATSSNIQQQQLAQLDQVLQQLGLNPDTIGLFNQLAMLAYINDPAALEAFVQQLTGAANQKAQTTTTTTGATTNTTSAGGNSDAATTAVTAAQNTTAGAPSATASAQTATNTQAALGTPIPAELVIAEFPAPEQTAQQIGTTDANQNGAQYQNAAATNSNEAAAANTGLVIQFKELQLAFAAAAGSGTAEENVGATNLAPGATISVTI